MKRSIALLATAGFFVFGMMAVQAADPKVKICHTPGHENDFIFSDPATKDERDDCKDFGGQFKKVASIPPILARRGLIIGALSESQFYAPKAKPSVHRFSSI